MNITQQIESIVWPRYIFFDDNLREHRLGVWYPSQPRAADQIEEDTRNLLNSMFGVLIMSIVKKITEAVWPDHIFDDLELLRHRQGTWYAPPLAPIDDLSPTLGDAFAILDFEDFR